MSDCCPPPPRATPRDRRSYHFPPKPLECPRCRAWPFDPDDGCGFCGLGRAYPVPLGLDPSCNIARGWASSWPNGSHPTAEQIEHFVRRHGPRCHTCYRYRRPWRKALRRARLWLVDYVSKPTHTRGGNTPSSWQVAELGIPSLIAKGQDRDDYDVEEVVSVESLPPRVQAAVERAVGGVEADGAETPEWAADHHASEARNWAEAADREATDAEQSIPGAGRRARRMAEVSHAHGLAAIATVLASSNVGIAGHVVSG